MTQTDRIADLEIMLAHQARTIEELSAEVARAWEMIERQQKTLKELAGRLVNMEEVALPRPEITRPPHY